MSRTAWAAVVTRDEAEALHRIEELDRSAGFLAGQLPLRAAAVTRTSANTRTGSAAAALDRHRLAFDAQIGRRDAATAIDQSEFEWLAVGEVGETGLLDRGNVDKHILATVIATLSQALPGLRIDDALPSQRWEAFQPPRRRRRYEPPPPPPPPPAKTAAASAAITKAANHRRQGDPRSRRARAPKPPGVNRRDRCLRSFSKTRRACPAATRHGRLCALIEPMPSKLLCRNQPKTNAWPIVATGHGAFAHERSCLTGKRGAALVIISRLACPAQQRQSGPRLPRRE